MATNTAPLVEEEPRRERVALLPLVVWLIAVAILGFTEFGIYWLCGFLGAGCPTYEGQMGPGRLIGGPASHGAVLTAGALGLAYWIAAGAAARWFRIRLRSLAFAFFLAYGVSLIVLWQVAGPIWSNGHCL